MLDPSKRRFVINIKMFLIPFIYKKKESMYDVHIFHIFLNKGIMFLENNLVDEFLNENELYYKEKIVDKNFCYIEIDTDKTDISLFYTYNENSDVECWRRFIYIGSSDDLHINKTNPEFILPVLDFIKSIKSL
jgi:hypothetical protein